VAVGQGGVVALAKGIRGRGCGGGWVPHCSAAHAAAGSGGRPRPVTVGGRRLAPA
jgi:hypothetical protein